MYIFYDRRLRTECGLASETCKCLKQMLDWCTEQQVAALISMFYVCRCAHKHSADLSPWDSFRTFFALHKNRDMFPVNSASKSVLFLRGITTANTKASSLRPCCQSLAIPPSGGTDTAAAKIMDAVHFLFDGVWPRTYNDLCLRGFPLWNGRRG